MAANKWKDRKDIVYSTNPDYKYESNEENKEKETLHPSKQKLKVYMDVRARKKGKQATLINGFVGSEEDLKELAKLLKTKCAVGGSIKDNEIIIQGDFRDKIVEILTSQGYKATKL
ncbi:MAG: translation initiation factor SUI1 [Bacteroidetes bacterium GWC2_33_15]|nr:MAG: translation initiation factor SUI1 [Bacteroidetes bacterium GWA2_33_15]OFX50899.1 MAG: translation initiation factor SUI1 [Bacteroidetes bacterium GWC2_33_15]OFX63066.1 MAG: translation initiation factor SUI1 [Bacteroidetes bacterium GWB2_32_14]OFX70053.1 MAG: translation initiation factor SUI1 [Bacteroidetes bacterium GWD2_33_33]HAN18904.1 translation initiation factor [Bacteroidales bacterium]